MNVRQMLAVSVLALTALCGAVAHAAEITVVDNGTIGPNPADVVFFNGTLTSTASVVTGGDTGSNWNPYGSNATSYHWLGMGYNNNGDTATFSYNAPETTLSLLWGSPSATNEIQLYTAQGALIGTVSANGNGQLLVNGNVVISNANLDNVQSAGSMISITSSVGFEKAVFTTAAGYGGFEVAQVSAVPVPGALPLFGSALVGIGVMARRRAKKATKTA
jgi:hypothetical protein